MKRAVLWSVLATVVLAGVAPVLAQTGGLRYTITVTNAVGVIVATTAPDALGTYTVELATGSYEIEFKLEDDEKIEVVEVTGDDPQPAALTEAQRLLQSVV